LRILDTARLDEFFDHTGMADNFREKAVTLIAGRWLFQAAQFAKHRLT